MLEHFRRSVLFQEGIAACLFLVISSPSFATTPAWWIERGVIVPGRPADDYAVINQGQLKRIVASAVEEMNAKLYGGAGTSLNALLASWVSAQANADDFAVATVGQVKVLTKLIYERLVEANVLVDLPEWMEVPEQGNDDFALANMGQVKSLLAFQIPDQLGQMPPAGWQGSEWTQNPITILPEQNIVTGYPAQSIKNYFVNDFNEEIPNYVHTELEWRYAEGTEISGAFTEPGITAIYQLRNGENSGGHNPFHIYDAPGTWWTAKPSGYLTGGGLSRNWGPCYNTDSKQYSVAYRYTTDNYSYNPGDWNNAPLTGGVRVDVRWSEVRMKLLKPNILSDRQIIKEYWRSDDLSAENSRRRYRFVINAGTSRSSQEINFEPKLLTEGYVWLKEATPIPVRNISPSDCTGPRYRKIGLNGVPLSDSTPESQAEDDIPEDETYVDAYSRNLRHSVTDIWSKVASTQLPLAIRRTNCSESWSWNGSLHPVEKTDRPFGAGFTSNVTGQIKFQTTNDAFNHISKGPDRAVVTDENGTSHSFIRINDHWVNDLEQKQDAESCFNRLVMVPGSIPIVWELRKKYGTTCRFEMVRYHNVEGISQDTLYGGGRIQKMSSDRIHGSNNVITYSYGRIKSVVDHTGNRLAYTYPDEDGAGDRDSFIPSRIYDPDRPALSIYIDQNDGLVSSVKGPSGESVFYEYENKAVNEAGAIRQIPVLKRVVRGSSLIDESAVKTEYSFIYASEDEVDVDPTVGHGARYGHIDLESITDERGNEYHFDYAGFAASQQTSYQYFNGYYDFSKRLCGGSRLLSGVTLPNAHQVTFGGNRALHYLRNGSVQMPPGGLITTVSSSAGSYTYAFSRPWIYRPAPVASDSPLNVIVSFSKMDITSAAGTESYEFAPEAGMALKKATDASGNTTSYTYDDQLVSPTDAEKSFRLIRYDDPTTETNAIHSSSTNGIKRYEYDSKYRQLKKIVDERGTVTEYEIDNLGRRTQEKVTEATGRVLRVTDFVYDNPVFAGFMTSRIVQSTGLGAVPEGMAAPVGQMRTDYEADENGRVKTQKVYSGPDATKPLITSYTYTENGSRRTVTDPRNNTTTFEYYPHTLRLKKVVHPDQSSKELFYDAHGNLEREVNELGTLTLHSYDELNRRTKTTVDLDENGQSSARYTTAISSGPGESPVYNGDIVSETTYNSFNLPVDETDARGTVTHHDYDSIGRRIRTTINYNGLADEILITEYVDSDPETQDWVGGSLFDISGFKPLYTKQPRGFVTKFKYDKLYRPIEATLFDTTYAPVQQVTTKTQYDPVGNVVLVTDPLGNITRTHYDGLSRPIRVILPSVAGGEDTNVPYAEKRSDYTPSGLVWRTIDELGNTAYNLYDNAGRLVTSILPPVLAVGNPNEMLSPRIWHSYDAASNLKEKSDGRGNITETIYNLRNWIFKVKAPPVQDAATGQMDRPTTETTYDALGQVETVKDPLGRVTETRWDRAGRSYATIAPTVDGAPYITTSSFDPSGNILTATDAKDQTVTNVYDGLSRLKSTTDGAQITNVFGYDKGGNRTSVKDGLNQETVFVYDAQNRLRRQDFENGDYLVCFYNQLNKISQVDSRMTETSYRYDVRNRLRRILAPDLDRTLAYDSAGRLVAVREAGRPQATVAYGYDALGRVTSESSVGHTHYYGYDLAGNRVRAEYATGRVVATSYDALNRPDTIGEDGRITTYGYDMAGRALQLTAGNGQVTKNQYDELGRLKGRTLYVSVADLTATGILADFGWKYDQANNVKEHSEQWNANNARPAGLRKTEMTYDGANRLWTEKITDPSAGESTTTYTYDDANNRESKTVVGGAEPGYWYYDYDSANRLDAWTRRDEPNGTLLTSSVLNYDRNGNRTHQVVTGQSGSASHASLTDQGITYQAAAAGPAGNEISVTLNANQANQALGANVENGNHLVVSLATGAASADTLINQGVTYTGTNVHQSGQEISINLIASEAGQEAEEVLVDGRDITVKLATTAGAAAKAALQGVSYQAVVPGLEGNAIEVRLEKAAPGAPASVSRDGDLVTVHLETDAGNPDSVEVQGITYIATSPRQEGDNITLSLLADEPDQMPGVMVAGTPESRQIQVTLETDAGSPAQADHGGMHLEAATSGVDGNALQFAMETVGATDPFEAVVSPTTPQVTVKLPWQVGKKAGLTLPGVVYTANAYGLDGNSITVTHVQSSGADDPTSVSVDGNAITVHLGTLSGVMNASASDVVNVVQASTAASALVQVAAQGTDTPSAGSGSLSGGKVAAARRQPASGQDPAADELLITYNDVVELLEGATSSAAVIFASGGNAQPVAVAPGQPVLVEFSGGGDSPGVETTVAQLVALLNTNQSFVTAAAGDSGLEKVQPLQATQLTGGREPEVITTTQQVAVLLAASSSSNAHVNATGGSALERAEPGSVGLVGGGLGFEITSTVTSVVQAVNSEPSASALVTASGTGTTAVAPITRTFLSGGQPQVLSDADDVVTLLNGHTLVTVTGGGSLMLRPLSRTYLSSTVQRTTYAWDRQDRLIGVTMSDGTHHTYTYDYRVRRVETARQSGPQPDQVTTNLFSGGLSLAEYERTTTTTPVTVASPTVHYVRGPDMGGGVGGMLYSIRGTNLKYNLSNGRGDIVAQSDSTGTLTWTASYEAYGKRTKETGTNTDKQRANTKDEDPTGLLNEGFRYRDIETGVWLSRDPAGFVDGPNLYAYVKQNPWTSFDPDGLRAADNEYLKKAKELSGPRPILDTLKGIGYGLIGTLQELNPFSGNSEITHTRQEFSKGVTHALDEIEAAPIPRVMKSVAKFGVGVGTAGDSLNPLNLFTDLTATARTIKEKGALQVSSNTLDNLVDNIKNHPEAILGQVTTYSSLFNRNVGEIATKGKEGARITFGDPAAKQLSLNAYTNNAKIGPYLPGLGVNILEAGKRVFGIEYHRFNLKNNGGSAVKLHRHSGPTSSQVSKHRKLLSDETY